jgi:hypothetical protein
MLSGMSSALVNSEGLRGRTRPLVPSQRAEPGLEGASETNNRKKALLLLPLPLFFLA